MSEGRSFGWALDELCNGGYVARSGWNGEGMWLGLWLPDGLAKMSLPYIYMRTVQGDFVPWTPSQTDMLAEDWVVVV